MAIGSTINWLSSQFSTSRLVGASLVQPGRHLLKCWGRARPHGYNPRHIWLWGIFGISVCLLVSKCDSEGRRPWHRDGIWPGDQADSCNGGTYWTISKPSSPTTTIWWWKILKPRSEEPLPVTIALSPLPPLGVTNITGVWARIGWPYVNFIRTDHPWTSYFSVPLDEWQFNLIPSFPDCIPLLFLYISTIHHE